jgi:hypothetical protein
MREKSIFDMSIPELIDDIMVLAEIDRPTLCKAPIPACMIEPPQPECPECGSTKSECFEVGHGDIEERCYDCGHLLDESDEATRRGI